MSSLRIEKLLDYRTAREQTLNSTLNSAGEASGRTWTGDVTLLKQRVDLSLKGPRLFVNAFKNMLELSPVEVREGELIVGDYYYGFFGEVIPVNDCVRDKGYQAFPTSGHTVGNLKRALKLGWNGIKAEVASSLKKHSEKQNEKETEYLGCQLSVIELIQGHIIKYAKKAEKLAACCDGAQHEEYMTVAKICRKISTEPPSSFREALQWHWFYITFERVTSAGMGGCKIDTVFYDYYKSDLDNGTITRDEAVELLCCNLLKEGLFYSTGGVKSDGSDAVNDLSFAVLEAYDIIGGPSNLNVRWHPEINGDFFNLALDILSRHKTSVPNIVNDRPIIKSLMKCGFDEKEARGYNFAGCFWFVIPGKEYTYHDMEAISATHILVDTIRECTKNSVDSFDEFLSVFRIKQEECIAEFSKALEAVDMAWRELYPEMVLSLIMDGCIDKGIDVNNGGALRSMITVLYVGLATTADSLYAIKKMVFEERCLDIKKLYSLMEEDFASDPLLLKKLRSLPKFGNNVPEVDEIADMLFKLINKQAKNAKNHRNERYRIAYYSWNRHIYEGSTLMATPDGRLSKKPVSMGINPSHSCAKNGVTGMLSSIGKHDFGDMAGAPIHVHLGALSRTEHCHEVVKALVTEALSKDIPQIIVNFTDPDLLKKAYEHPEEYWDLIIRVTGYSARFAHLGESIKKEVIERNIY